MTVVDDDNDELERKCRTWLEEHPEALEDLATAFVRQHPASGTFVKRTTGGDVQIAKDEFEVRQWVLMHPEVLAKIHGLVGIERHEERGH
jgi:hypothetical protein